MSPLEQAAIDYVAARIRNEDAEPRDWSERAAEIDRTYHLLCGLAGFGLPAQQEHTEQETT